MDTSNAEEAFTMWWQDHRCRYSRFIASQVGQKQAHHQGQKQAHHLGRL